jgi:hypothetical protein
MPAKAPEGSEGLNNDWSICGTQRNSRREELGLHSRITYERT